MSSLFSQPRLFFQILVIFLICSIFKISVPIFSGKYQRLKIYATLFLLSMTSIDISSTNIEHIKLTCLKMKLSSYCSDLSHRLSHHPFEITSVLTILVNVTAIPMGLNFAKPIPFLCFLLMLGFGIQLSTLFPVDPNPGHRYSKEEVQHRCQKCKYYNQNANAQFLISQRNTAEENGNKKPTGIEEATITANLKLKPDKWQDDRQKQPLPEQDSNGH